MLAGQRTISIGVDWSHYKRNCKSQLLIFCKDHEMNRTFLVLLLLSPVAHAQDFRTICYEPPAVVCDSGQEKLIGALKEEVQQLRKEVQFLRAEVSSLQAIQAKPATCPAGCCQCKPEKEAPKRESKPEVTERVIRRYVEPAPATTYYYYPSTNSYSTRGYCRSGSCR